MSRPVLAEGEETRLICPASYAAKYLGMLYLTNQRAMWVATDAQAAVQRVEMNWYDVKEFKKNEKKSMMRVRSEEGNDMVVEFLKSGELSPAACLQSAVKHINRELNQARGRDGAGSRPASAPKSLEASSAAADSDDGGAERPRGVMGWGKGEGARRRKRGIFAGVSGGQPLTLDSLPEGSVRKRSRRTDLAKANLLSNPVLKQHYNEVVGGGIVSEEDFWDRRQNLLCDEIARISAVGRGTSSFMVADIQGVKEDGKERFTLTPESITSIFRMYPAVERAYMAMVPHQLSEKEFWTKYFQSQYRDLESGGSSKGGPKISAGDDMFSRYAAEIEEEEKKKRGQRKVSLKLPHEVDPTVNLVSQFSDFHSRETDARTVAEQEEEVDRQKVVNKYNRHASMVLYPTRKSSGRDEGSSGGSANALAYLPDDNPKRATELTELRAADGKPPTQPLTLSNVQLYKRSAVASSAAAAPVSLPSASEGEDGYSSILPAGDGICLLKGIPTPKRALEILKSCTKETSLGAAASSGSYPQDFVTRMHRHFQVISELLRHFYYAYGELSHQDTQAKSNAVDLLQRKLKRLADAMGEQVENLMMERKALPRDATGNQMSAVIKPLSDSLNHALTLADFYLRQVNTS